MHCLRYLRVIKKKAKQHFVKLGCILYLDKKTQCLKFGSILAGLNFNHLLRNQMPRGLFCLMDTTRRTTHIINEIQGKGHPEVKRG